MNNIPLHSIEAEQSVLGGLMLDNSKWDEVSKLLTVDDFYESRNKLIFDAISTVANKDKKFDILIISQELKEKGEFERAGGDVYIFGISNNTPNAYNITTYAEIVKKKSFKRKKISIAEELKKHPENYQVV